jgi:hypothetical protein
MRRLTIERTTEIILFVLLFALATRIPLDTDTWWHLRSGEYLLTEGFIYTDPFSFTMQGQPWINHSWGAQLIMHSVWRLAGDVGLAFYTAGLATAGMFIVSRMCGDNTYLRAFVLILGAAAAAVFWSPRPHMLSFFLSTVLLYLLYLHKYKQQDRLWWIPPLMALWGNLHAGFSIGFIFLAGSIAGEILNMLLHRTNAHNIGWHGIRRLILISLLSAAALCINPYGLNILLVPFQTVSIGVLRDFIQEWGRPDFTRPEILPFAVLLIATALGLLANRRHIDGSDVVLAAGTAVIALLGGRNIAVFAVAATPVLSRALTSLLKARGWVFNPLKHVSPRMARLNAILIGVIALGALAKIAYTLDPALVAQAKADALPLGAVAYLQEERPQARLFNSYNWGGYLIYSLPDIPVFVDGRTDLYGDALLTRYLDAATASDDWQAVLDEYAIDTVLIETESGLAAALREQSDWQLLYENDLASLFARREG